MYLKSFLDDELSAFWLNFHDKYTKYKFNGRESSANAGVVTSKRGAATEHTNRHPTECLQKRNFFDNHHC